jgi:beta-glucanase (GH16 family)
VQGIPPVVKRFSEQQTCLTTFRSSSGWTLTWSDEFACTNGASPDASKWVLETGGNGWGNNELEYYTNRSQNAFQKDGNLVITVLKETFTGSEGVTRNYTSARLKTATHFTQAYGRFEARLRSPKAREFKFGTLTTKTDYFLRSPILRYRVLCSPTTKDPIMRSRMIRNSQ